MDISDGQNLMREIYLERDNTRGVNGTLIRTFQELAELSEAVSKNQTMKDIQDELADVFAWLLSLANLLKIDMTRAFLMKYGKGCPKCFQTPCACK
ncbi:nucleotide pyrophosphohydrolase [Candidatus Thorarchaeota archaeon]|nr:MAG: nucleotide pyrophosphohydrolase [Candidatus Thorarchaeota archaeon]